MINKLLNNAQKNITETEQKQNKSRTNREQGYRYYYTRRKRGYPYYYTRFFGLPLLLHAIFTPTLTTTY